MMDPKEIEGSPERAADRGREEDLGFQAPTAQPSLGDPDVVRGLVTEFASQVVAARRAYNEDKLDGEAAIERVRELAREYGNVIMGRDRRYQPLPWNDPARLGRRIRLVVPAQDGVEDPGELLFTVVGSSLVSLAAAHEDDRMSDDDVKSKVDVMLADTCDLLLGLR